MARDYHVRHAELTRIRVVASVDGKSPEAGFSVEAGRLESRGCTQEFSPDGKEPTLYAYDRLDPTPVTRLAGRLTKFGAG